MVKAGHEQIPHALLLVQCVLEFPLACGIRNGTPVRIRGVPVGDVIGVTPSLERVNVVVEVCRPHQPEDNRVFKFLPLFDQS